MILSHCTDPEVGALLHAYELHVLSREDVERFELHMMRCEYCLNEVKNFQKATGLITSDLDIREVMGGDARESGKTKPSVKKVLEYLWPAGTPTVFRPALAYLVVALLILPAYWGLKTLPSSDVRTGSARGVQMMYLFPDRSMGREVFKIGDERDGLISFLFRDATPGETYKLSIETDDGEVIFRDDSFDDFDEFGTGHLILPHAEMKPGIYRLSITNPRAEPPINRQEYRFRIES